MEVKTNKILQGEEVEEFLPYAPLGRLFLDKIKGVDSNKIALVNANTGATITYGEIFKRSVELANYLKQYNLKQGEDIVAIVSENSTTFCIPLLASLYLSLIVNPVSSFYSKDELERAFCISTPKIVFCSESALETVLEASKETSSVKVIVFGETTPFFDANTAKECLIVEGDINTFEAEEMDPEKDVSVILCSSGTTGFPKGVMLTSQSFRYYLIIMNDPRFGVGGASLDDVVLIVAPFFHLMGFSQLLYCLYDQLLAVVISKFRPALFLESIQKHRVTNLFVVPTLMSFLSHSPLVEQYDLSSIRRVLWAGASMSKDIEAAVKRRLNLDDIRSLYAATETGTAIILQTDKAKPESTGRLTLACQGKVCEPDTDEPLGPNQVGELRFKSPYIMKGYVNNPEATASSFDADGFLKTGDAGYYDEEENFYIVDRYKDLIKYKGFQVPPAEVEGILLSHPAVKEAAVVGRPDNRAGELPVAFIVKEENLDISEQELIDMVASKLSFHKRLHGGVIFVNELPKNKIGKVLRRQLRELANVTP